ncbi:MAG TPA: glycosyltransferase family 2 protein [Gaiellaceae bacterium]|nr:glycosyltransferase family 2 protein [Gaiellaceae bacterium]
MPVSAVIPHRNSGELLAQCVDALLAARGVDEIVVADEDSTDGSIERVAGKPKVRVVESTRRGFAAAMNVAIAESVNDRLLLLNSDAFVRIDTVERLDRRLDENPRLALCGAALFNPDGTRSKTHTFRFTFWRALADTLNIRPLIAQVGHGLELTHAVLPTCALARREALEEIGGFDERFLLYYEDLDVVQRLAQAGWLQAIDWDAEAVHVSGGSTSVGARQRWFAQYHRSRAIYMRKHYPHGWPVYAAMWAGKASTHAVTWSVRARLRARHGDDQGAQLAREWAHAFRSTIRPAAPASSERPDDVGEPTGERGGRESLLDRSPS